MTGVAIWIGLAACLLLIAFAIGVARMRTLFATATYAFAGAVCAALAALAVAAPETSVALAFAGCFVFAAVTSATLLTTRAAAQRPIGARIAPLTAGALTAGVLLWCAPEIGLLTPMAHAAGGEGFYALILLAGAAGTACLVGIGDRGVLDAPRDEAGASPYRAAHVALASAGKLLLPLLLLFALYLTFSAEHGGGVQGGLAAASAVALHALLFGPAATLRSTPRNLLKAIAALGALLIGAGAAADVFALAIGRPLGAGGALMCAGAGGALALISLIGRAHALRDEDW